MSIHALSKIFSVEHVFAYDIDSTQARRFANELSDELKMAVETTSDLGEAMKRSGICVTCTPSTRFFLKQDFVQPGRTSSDEIIIFDSTGMGLQDVITAASVYKKAVDKGVGRIIDLAQ